MATQAVMETSLRPLLTADLGSPPSGQVLVRYLWLCLAHSDVERVRVLFLDGRGHLLRDEEIARGDNRHAVLDPRAIVRRCLDLGAQRLVVAHNHPSGDPAPSVTDRRATDSLVAAARLFNIQVVDHVVLASGGWSSMRALGWLGK
ncbi:JAB domain-containing protein [Sphingomonas ginsengisoli (ex An et al. 2013)]|nr:JAB domain-containing protein [Sphingomonas ginsengisoli An et al. 2013]